MLNNIREKLYININEKFSSVFFVIVQAIVILAIGILVINVTSKFLMLIVYLISVFFFLIGISGVFQNLFSKHKDLRHMNILNSIFNIFVSIFMIYNPYIILSIFPLLFTVYILIDSIIKTVICIIYIENKLENRKFLILRTMLTYIFLIILVFFPMFRTKVTYLMAGLYFILLAVTYFLDAIDLLTPIGSKNKIKKRIRIVLPVYIAAFVPRKVLKEINKLLEVKEKYDKYIIQKEKVFPDIEVLVHIKESKTGSFGHVDLFIDNKVISYGSYDEASTKLNSSIGDGVLFEVDKHKYLRFCNRMENKNIISFGLKLTEEQKNSIRNKLNNIKKDTYEWIPLSKIDTSGEYIDYASRLYDATGAKFYKFKKGKYKIYFVLHTNCVQLADEILGTSGIDLLSINGLITPGTYYDYFNREFRRKNSIVVSKEIYLNKTKAIIKK